MKDCWFAFDLSDAIWTASEDRAFGFNVSFSFISDIVVECKEAELYRVIWIDKLGHLLEVGAV